MTNSTNTYFVKTSKGNLCYAVYGIQDFRTNNVTPLVYLHGYPGSRIEASFAEEFALAKGISIIAFDRPGYGYSDFMTELTLSNWSEVFFEAITLLGLEEINLLAVSGGGPYALSILANSAYSGPKPKISRATIVSGLGPLFDSNGNLLNDLIQEMVGINRSLLRIASRFSWLGSFVSNLIALIWSLSPRLALFWFRAAVSKEDKAQFDKSVIAKLFRANIREGLRNHTKQVGRDLTFYTRPWQFNLKAITLPPQFWHGNQDIYVPPAFAKYLAKEISGANLNLIDKTGHLLITEITKEILSSAVELNIKEI